MRDEKKEKKKPKIRFCSINLMVVYVVLVNRKNIFLTYSVILWNVLVDKIAKLMPNCK